MQQRRVKWTNTPAYLYTFTPGEDKEYVRKKIIFEHDCEMFRGISPVKDNKEVCYVDLFYKDVTHEAAAARFSP